MITIKSEDICDENLGRYAIFGMIKSNGGFLSIKEQYEHRTKTPMMGFYMVDDTGMMCTADNFEHFKTK